MNQQKSTFIFILTLGILSMLPPFGVDMYLPSFLEIAKDLDVSPEQSTTHAHLFCLWHGVWSAFLGAFW